LLHLDELAAIGITGVVVSAHEDVEKHVPMSGNTPVVMVAPETDMRALQGEIERYIARRRRELFALEQRLYRTLTEAAIGGADIVELLAAAVLATSGKTAIFDRDGDVIQQPAHADPLPAEVLVRTRIAVHALRGAPVQVDGSPPILAMPVLVGNERRGIVMLVGAAMPTLDDDEAAVRSLASACAIVLTRVPEEPTLALDAVLRGFGRPSGATQASAWERVIALAVEDSSSSVRQLERALRSELTIRGIEHTIGSVQRALVVITSGGEDLQWEDLVRSVGLRLGSGELRAGLGRQRRSVLEAARSCWEAEEALRHAGTGGLTRFPQIELATLLRADPGWTEFARSRLGPLLEGGSGNEDLLLTLRAFLDAGQNAKEAARDLHVHRNTLTYRLRRIRNLLALDLEDAQVLFELDLSLRAIAAGAGEVTEAGGSG
jgi:hypothetical protein